MTRVGEYPALGPLAGRLARLHGLRTILVVGAIAAGESALEHPDLEFIELQLTPTELASGLEPGFRRRVALQPSSNRVAPLTPAMLESSVILCALDTARSTNDANLGGLRAALDLAPVLIIASDDPRLSTPSDLGEALTRLGLSPTFMGRTQRHTPQDAMVAIVDRIVGDRVDNAPPDFSVVAFITTYNEADVIGATIRALAEDGIGVYLIDNWSTDGTREIAEGFRGRGLIGMELYPDTPAPTFNLTELLTRVEGVAAALPSRWFIHHDADERREGPWPDHSLRDALWAVERAGFNAVDHTILNFRPIDNGFPAGTDYAAYFRTFEFGDTPDMLLQVKAWRNTGQRVSLAATGGHDVAFPGRRVFPYKFLLKHYPVRSQAHGEQKVLVERRGRWDPSERARGWHGHYDAITPAHRFVRDPSELIEFVDGQTHRDYLLPIVAGVGLGASRVPDWAVRSRSGARIYRAVQEVGVAKGFLRHSVIPKVPLARRVARRVRRSAPRPPS